MAFDKTPMVACFRRGLALNQTEMAELLGMDRAHLSRIESGQRQLTDKLALRFAALRNRARAAVEGEQ